MGLRRLTPQLQSLAVTELDEVTSRIPEDVAHIRKWITQQSHLKARTDDQWILNFLRGCKFSLDRTKEKLDNFYTVRSALPEFFAKRDPLSSEIQHILKLGLFLPIDTKDGPKIFVVRTANVDPTHVSLIDITKVCLMITDIILNEDDYCVIQGQRFFVDFGAFNKHQLLRVTPTLCQKAILCLKDVYPCRLKGFYIINMHPIFESIINIGKVIMGKKLSSRVVAYSKDNLQSLYNNIPKSALPADYGGEGETIEALTVKWKSKVESYRDMFLEDAKYGCDESKRIRKSVLSEHFGIEGSFRKLNID